MLITLGGVLQATAQEPEVLKALHELHQKAMNTQDVNQMMSYWTDDMVYDVVTTPPPLSGKEAVGAFFEALFQGLPDFHAFPDMHVEPVRMIDMGDGWVLHEVIYSGTHEGPLFGVPATGNSFEIRAAFLARFDEDGLEANLYVYVDNMTLMMQLGLIPPPVDTEANKALVRRYFEEVWNKGNLDLVDELVSVDIVGHVREGEFTGFEGNKQHVISFRTPFPDVHITIEDLIAEGDKVAMRYTVTGTHKDELMGIIPPTGKQVTMTGIVIFRIADGKFGEVWSIVDMLGLMQQLGVIPTMGREYFTWGEPSPVTGDSGSPEENKVLDRRNYKEIWNQRNMDLIYELFATDYIFHDPVNPKVESAEDWK